MADQHELSSGSFDRAGEGHFDASQRVRGVRDIREFAAPDAEIW